MFALDHACPHEGYGLTQGELDGDLLTCAWHNWKFRVDDGACVLGEEDVRTHAVDRRRRRRRAASTLVEPDPAELRPQLLGQPAARDRQRTTSARCRATSCGCCGPTPTRAS